MTNKNLPKISLLLFIVIIALISSISNMIPPNLRTISIYFGFGGDTFPLGFLTAIFTIISGFAMLIFGYLADKFVRKWIIIIGSSLFAIFSTLTIIIMPGFGGYLTFFIFAVMMGVGYGALIPSSFSLIADIVSEKDRSKGFSFFSIASLFGIVLGNGLAAFTSDWRTSFWIIGIAGLITTFFLTSVKEPSRIGFDRSNLSNTENQITYPYRIKPSDLPAIFKKKSNFWLIINFIDTIPTGIILFLLYEYMLSYHGIVSETTIFLLLFILLATLVGTIVFGYLGDKWFSKGNQKARVKLALYGNILPIPFVFIALIIPFRAPNIFPGIVIWVVLMMIGIFLNGAVNGNWYATVVDVNLPEHRGTVLATSNFFDIIGRSIGPVVGAVIADTLGFVYGMMISIFFWALIPFFWIGVLKNIVPEMEQTTRIFDERLQKIS
jgi:MFS family permease